MGEPGHAVVRQGQQQLNDFETVVVIKVGGDYRGRPTPHEDQRWRLKGAVSITQKDEDIPGEPVGDGCI